MEEIGIEPDHEIACRARQSAFRIAGPRLETGRESKAICRLKSMKRNNTGQADLERRSAERQPLTGAKSVPQNRKAWENG